MGEMEESLSVGAQSPPLAQKHICHRDTLILENWKRSYVLIWVVLVSYHGVCIIPSAVEGKVERFVHFLGRMYEKKLYKFLLSERVSVFNS